MAQDGKRSRIVIFSPDRTQELAVRRKLSNFALEFERAPLKAEDINFRNLSLVAYQFGKPDLFVQESIESIRSARRELPIVVFWQSSTPDPESIAFYEKNHVHTYFKSRITGRDVTSEIHRILQMPRSVREETPEELRDRLLELSNRLQKVADAIAQLRVNSAADLIEEIRAIGNDLLLASDDAPKTTTSVSSMRRRLDKDSRSALRKLSNLYDVLGSRQGAEMIVAGAVAGILGLMGWPAVTAYGLGLAAWRGKEAFQTALEKAFQQRR